MEEKQKQKQDFELQEHPVHQDQSVINELKELDDEYNKTDPFDIPKNNTQNNTQNNTPKSKKNLHVSFANNIPVPPPLPSPIKNSLFIRKNNNQIENNKVKDSVNDISKDEKNNKIGKVLIPKGLEDKLSNIYCCNLSNDQKTTEKSDKSNNNTINNSNNNFNNQSAKQYNIQTSNNTSNNTSNINTQHINNMKIEVSDESLQQIVKCIFKNDSNKSNIENLENKINKDNINTNISANISANIDRYENRLVRSREELLLLLLGVFIGIFSSNYKFFIP